MTPGQGVKTSSIMDSMNGWVQLRLSTDVTAWAKQGISHVNNWWLLFWKPNRTSYFGSSSIIWQQAVRSVPPPARSAATHVCCLRNGFPNGMLHFLGQCIMHPPPSDPSHGPVRSIQTILPNLFVPLLHNVQQENVRQEEGPVPQSLRVQEARRAAHNSGDRLRHRHKFSILSARLQGDLHRPQSSLSEISEDVDGRERPALLWEIFGGVGGGHGVNWERFGRRGCLHPGALQCQRHTANSARDSPHAETSKSSATPEIPREATMKWRFAALACSVVNVNAKQLMEFSFTSGS